MEYIIADASGEMAKILYGDILEEDNFHLIDKNNLFQSRFIQWFCMLNISLKANKYFRMPLKNFFYRRIFGKFKDSKNLCFYIGVFWYDKDLIKYLKQKYPSAFFVFVFHDTVESKKQIFPGLEMAQMKEEFHEIYTYSILDAEKYNLQYMPDMYSKISSGEIIPFPEYDVVFIGAAKDRLSLLIQIYDKLAQSGLDCWFYIVGAEKAEQVFREGIVYSDKYLPFSEVLSRQISSRCLLEVTQKGCVDATLRFWDAVMYNKKIITNCSAVTKYKYYNPEYVNLFSDVSEIDVNLIKKVVPVDYQYEGDLSPKKCFETIRERLINEDC